MSIGALSRATGVPTETLRTWERRYGFPLAERTDSGHRRYSSNTLHRLRLVTRLLELGHKPSDVLGMDEPALRVLLSESTGALPVREGLGVGNEPLDPADSQSDAQVRAEWLELIARFEGRAFDRALSRSWAVYGALPFLERLLGPFLEELGAQWASGAIGVRHEHFASERVREFLAQRWRPMSDAAAGPLLVLATLPGELHVLGLHMAALTVALANARVVMLGADAPPAEILNAVQEHGAQAIVLSSAQGSDPDRTANDLARLTAQAPERLRIVVGGAGFDHCPDRVEYLPTLGALSAWVEAL